MSQTKSLTPSVNGRKRPQLNDSIHRLDSILDGLAEAIPATVADSIREGLAEAVRQAVMSALAEALTAPGGLAALAATQPLPQATPEVPTAPVRPESTTTGPTRPSFLRTGLDRLGAAWAAASATASTWLCVLLAWCCGLLRLAGSAGSALWAARVTAGTGLAAGASAGVLAYLAGPLAASFLLGLTVAAGVVAWPVLAVAFRLATVPAQTD